MSVIGSSYVVGLDEYSDEKIRVTGSSGTVSERQAVIRAMMIMVAIPAVTITVAIRRR